MTIKFFVPMAIGVYTLILFSTISSKAQFNGDENNTDCLDDNFEKNSYSIIKFMKEDYVYLKSKAFSSKISSVINFPLTLKKNVLYVFSACESADEEKSSLRLKLYDKDGTLVDTSMNIKNTKVINFKPSQAGKYNITATFDNGDNCCLILCGMINSMNQVFKNNTRLSH